MTRPSLPFQRYRRNQYFIVALLFVCAAIFVTASGFARRSNSAAVAPAGSTSEKELSAKDRVDDFETVWKTIRDIYYDPEFHGINWQDVHDRYRPQIDQVKSNAEFFTLLNHMAGELHDAHTRFNTPEQWQNRQKFQGVGTGILLDEIEGKVAVSYVYADSNAARAGVEPGMILVSVNGKPIADAIAESAAKVTVSSTERITHLRVIGGVLGGAPDTSVKLSLQRADKSNFDVTVARQILPLPPDVRAHSLPSGVAYFRFDNFMGNVTKEFHEALAQYHNAPGLIIDLRWNGGGRADILLSIAGFLLNQKTTFSKVMTRKDIEQAESAGEKPDSPTAPDKGHQRELKAGKDGEQQYAGPVVILTDTRTGSSSEIFSGGLQELGRAKVVGTETCGCVIGIHNETQVKGGGVLEVSQILWFTPKGRKLEGDGVIPDLTVAPTIADLQAKRDPVLDAAEKMLREMGGHAN
ncbi:MAG TPA: S41 family peptidase [Candidatus Acidoferrum sp.]|nr:S41 family peptidase [Candidatus Acidoferrum sp.]